jgi:NAD(P)-dependent dehydrogenase (short-subunit alcohol dehydrogenase family)
MTASRPCLETVFMAMVLITGANRGLGLEFAGQYAAAGWKVIATCRSPEGAAELRDLAAGNPAVRILGLDVTDHARIDRLATELRDTAVDLLLLNSAYLGPQEGQKCGAVDYSLFERSFAANATGPMKMAEAFIPHVAASTEKKIVFLGSAAGSITLLRPPANLYAYRASKAATHLIAHNLALDLAPRGIRVGLVNPGLADTRGLLRLGPNDQPPADMAPIMALVRAGIIQLITPAEAVRGMIQVINGLDAATAGVFFNYDGTPIPW